MASGMLAHLRPYMTLCRVIKRQLTKKLLNLKRSTLQLIIHEKKSPKDIQTTKYLCLQKPTHLISDAFCLGQCRRKFNQEGEKSGDSA